MTCNCNCGNDQNILRMKARQQGDSTAFTMTHKVNDTPTDIGEGYTLAVGFYDFAGNQLLKLTTDEGISRVDTGTYYVFLSHTVTEDWVGDILLEFVIYNADGSVADATEQRCILPFEPRKLNN